MIVVFLLRPQQPEWKALYRAAILEGDRAVVPEKVSEAERAVIARGRELYLGDGTPEEPEEEEALDDALYALRAFRTALEHAEDEFSVTVGEAA